MSYKTFDNNPCKLGEGPLWHPIRQELFWFDIIGKNLFARKHDVVRHVQFDEHVSAAGWIDEDHLLIASQTALLKFQISNGQFTHIAELESDNILTRSNDGRADPWGGFWIGTMGLSGEKNAGAIYRFYRGELRVLYEPITISNAICFSPDRQWGYFADTAAAKIWRQKLAPADGWPIGEPEIFIDFSGTGIHPDGAVCDGQGYLWNAQWGAGRVAKYAPNGDFISATDLPTDHITCPAFGGDDLQTLFITSAREGLTAAQLLAQPQAGNVFKVQMDVIGQREHQIVL